MRFWTDYKTAGQTTFPALTATPCKPPKMSSHQGRSWDSVRVEINGEPVTLHYDSTWGKNYYFQWGGQWYRMAIIQLAIVWDADIMRNRKLRTNE